MFPVVFINIFWTVQMAPLYRVHAVTPSFPIFCPPAAHIVQALAVFVLAHNRRTAISVFLAGASHQLRDATRRGLWLYPPRGPMTSPLGQPVYLLAQALLPAAVALYLRWAASAGCDHCIPSEEEFGQSSWEGCNSVRKKKACFITTGDTVVSFLSRVTISFFTVFYNSEFFHRVTQQKFCTAVRLNLVRKGNVLSCSVEKVCLCSILSALFSPLRFKYFRSWRNAL